MKKHKVVAEEQQGIQESKPKRKAHTKVINRKARKSCEHKAS